MVDTPVTRPPSPSEPGLPFEKRSEPPWQPARPLRQTPRAARATAATVAAAEIRRRRRRLVCPSSRSPATARVAAALPAVRRGPGQGRRYKHRERLSHEVSPRAAEDSARVAGSALSDGQGRALVHARPSPSCRKRPFTTQADRRRPRLDGGRQSCIDEPARGTYVSPRSRARPSVPATSGSAALMNPHTTSLVSVPTAVNDGRRRLNQFQKHRMPTQRNP